MRWWFAALLFLFAPESPPPVTPCFDPTPEILTDGYCDQDGYEVPALIDWATYIREPPVYFKGRTLFQNNDMQATALINHCDTTAVEGLIALMSPSTLCQVMHIRVPTLDRTITVMQVDVAALPHYYPHVIFSRSPIEFSLPLAQETGLIEWTDPVTHDRYFDTEVCRDLLGCTGLPTVYKTWFLSIVQYQ